MTTRADVEAECERLGLDLDDVEECLNESQDAGGLGCLHRVREGHSNYWPLMLEATGWLEEQAFKPGAQAAYYERIRKASLT